LTLLSKPHVEQRETTGGMKADDPYFSHLEAIFASKEGQEEEHLSRLQEKILKIVCTRRNVDVDYVLLMKETNRDRVTIAQSVNSLVDRHFLSKEKINPEYEKSKVIIKPTFHGKDYSVNFLKVSLEDMLKAEDNEYIYAFLEFIKDISDPSQRHSLIDPLKTLFLWLHESWVTNFSVKGKNEVIKEVLMRGLKTGISQMVLNENYNAKKLLNKRSNEWLKKLFSSQEIRDLQHFIVYMGDNLVSTAKRFPV
jgi:hypothetical protein